MSLDENKEIQDQLNEQLQLQQQLQQIENLAKQYMSKEAISRYSNLKVAYPEIAIRVITLIAQAVSYGQIKENVTDEKFKEFLRQVQPEKKEFKIQRK